MALDEQNKQDLKLFFPRRHIQDVDGEEQGIQDAEEYELLVEKEKMLPFLQTLFFEERLIEIQVDHGTRIFFAALWDHLPDLEEQEQDDGETVLIEPEYQEGSYLQEVDHIVLSPLEPVVGNLKVRSSNIIHLCFYAGTNAVELATRFLRVDKSRDVSVLAFEFPSAGRIIRGNRPFRAKLPPDLEMTANLCSIEQNENTIDCDIMDISSQGLSVEHEELMNKFTIGDTINLTIMSPSNAPLQLHGTIRHFAKIRTKQGNSSICGIQFDLESRAMAETIEQLFTKIQRLFIRNLTERTEGQSIQLTLQ